MIVNMHAAKTNLSKLVARAEAGEEVIIASAGLQRVCLTPISVPDGQRKKGGWLEQDDFRRNRPKSESCPRNKNLELDSTLASVPCKRIKL